MTTVRDQLQLGFEMLSRADVAEPRREASSLLGFALGRDKTFLIAHPEYELTPKEEQLVLSVLKRRADREPFHYIIGKKEFYGLEFAVTHDVLIPRPETEILVEESIREMRANGWTNLCEIGVGSGCISVSILKNIPLASATAGDVSPGALAVAKRNAEIHGVLDRLTLRDSDVFENLGNDSFDLIVSNPPYVPAADISDLASEVRDHEPHQALTDGSDGLSIIRELVNGSKDRLGTDGILMIEIGWDQASRVREMFDVGHWQSIAFLPDLQGIPRIAKAIRR